MTFHPALSPSPLEKAFCYVASQSSSSERGNNSFVGSGEFVSSSGGITSQYRDNGDNDDDAENDLPPFWLSPPEVSLLRSAEENPLEYTLAETDDAVSYVRILLKMLDQVANNASAASAQQNNNSNFLINNSRSFSSPAQQPAMNNLRPVGTDDERILTLDTPVFSEDEAFDLYYRSTKKHKRLVVAHYCVTKIYEIVCVSLDSDGGIPSVADLFHGKRDDTMNNNNHHEDLEHGFDTIYLETEEWIPLLKILYNRSSDEYTKRGSALILAYILKAGCEMNEKASARMAATARSKPDEDLLDLFPEEQKTATSPSSFGAMLATTKSETAIEDTLHSLISWLTSRLQRSGAYASLGVVTPTLGVLMSTTKEARRAFVQSGGIGYISRHLRAKRPRLPPSTNTQTPQKKLGRPSNASGSSRQSALQPASVLLSEKPPSPVRHRKKKDASSFVVTNPFNSSASPDPMVGRSGSFGSIGSSVSSNVDRLDILQSLPSTEDVEKNLDSMFFTASEAAAAIARSAPSGLASLAAATMTEAAPPSSPKAKSAVASSSVQQLYDLVFCLWCLSLDCSADESVRKHFSRDGAIPALAHLLKKVPREKVLRVTLACLRSLSTLSDGSQSKHEQPFVRDMIGCAVLKSLETVKQRRWNDADLEEDLEFLRGFLKDCTQELTQWSAYEAQIATGILRWDDMLHTHDFLRANARHMEGSKADFAPLKRLVEVLYSNTTSGKLRRSGRADEISYLGLNEVGGWDEDDLKDDEICETLAVCLFDIGEFARNYPNGKAVLSSRCGIGAKALIMQYVHHPRDEVREQALLCASKIMVRNWRAIEN